MPFEPKHLLWGLAFLKTYSTEKILCELVNVRSRTTLRKYVWMVVKEIAALCAKVVSSMCV